ncbi:MAG: N-acetylneuraminate synthase, partial [Gemmatimonadetes bacterium]
MKKALNPQYPYIIGETAYHHEGDMDYLIRMIDDMAEMGLNAVKFHLMFDPESYMQKKHPLM